MNLIYNQVRLINDGTAEGNAATILHFEISSALESTAKNFVEFCGKLKEMRDTGLYKHIGFESFEDYAEKAHNIKQRQAYNYIQAYEKHSSEFLKENAYIGISKLTLLSQLSDAEKTETVAENDLAGMTVDEVKQLIKDKQDLGEQLDLLKSERQAEPIDVAAVETEIIDKAVKEAVALERENFKKEKRDLKSKAEAKLLAEQNLRDRKIAESVAAEKEKIINDTTVQLETELDKRIEALSSDAAEAKQRADRLEKELRLSKNDNTVRFSLIFSQVQDNLNSCNEIIEKVTAEDPETAEKFKKALSTVLASYVEVGSE